MTGCGVSGKVIDVCVRLVYHWVTLRICAFQLSPGTNRQMFNSRMYTMLLPASCLGMPVGHDYCMNVGETLSIQTPSNRMIHLRSIALSITYNLI